MLWLHNLAITEKTIFKLRDFFTQWDMGEALIISTFELGTRHTDHWRELMHSVGL